MRICSPEELPPDQAIILKEYARFFPAGSVCVNVILGHADWDLRPLLLIAGQVFIARFSAVLGAGLIRRIASQIEELSALANSPHSIHVLPGGERFMLLRSYQPETVLDLINREGELSSPVKSRIVRGTIEVLARLERNRLTHGHISLTNIALVDNGVVLLDPVIGSVHTARDHYFAPENSPGRAPDCSADLYSLGCLIRALFGDLLSERESEMVDKLVSHSATLRPQINQIARIFGVSIPSSDKTFIDTEDRGSKITRAGSGRLLRSNNYTENKGEPIIKGIDIETSGSTEGRGGSPRWEHNSNARGVGIAKVAIGVLVLTALVGWIIKERKPALYFEIVSRFPILAPQYSAEYEAEWASRDRSRMASVGRAAVIRREPAAINTIINDLLGGSNPDGANGALIRVAFSDTWDGELTPSDRHAALIFCLEELVPEGRSQLSQRADIHPGVVLAIIGQASARGIPAAFRDLEIDRLTVLPAPFGDLFAQVKAMGIKLVGEPQAIALAQIVTGNTRTKALQNFIGIDGDPAKTMAKIALIFPIISASPSAASELLNFLNEGEGDLATLLGWFGLEELGQWERVAARDKIQLILGGTPDDGLNIVQLADLLTFPIEKVRLYAISKLNQLLLSERSKERVLITLATPTLGLSREQTIAIVSAFNLPTEGRTPFIAAWFNLNPNPNAVLLLLLARSDADTSDLFNLEAARYLKRTEWGGTVDVFKLLSIHPEPLARVLAYTKMNPSIDAERAILEERQKLESDSACLKVLNERLANASPAE